MLKHPSWDRFYCLLSTHTRDIQVLYYPHRVSFEIPLYSESKWFGEKSYLRIDVPNSHTFLQSPENIEAANTIVLKADGIQLR